MPKGVGYDSSVTKAKTRVKKHRLNQKSKVGSKGKNRKAKGSAQKLPFTKQ